MRIGTLILLIVIIGAISAGIARCAADTVAVIDQRITQQLDERKETSSDDL